MNESLGEPYTRNKDLIGFIEQTAVVWKMALGSIIVWELARLTGSRHPYLAPLTLILCLQATALKSVRYALYRSVGTVIGVLIIGTFAKSIPVNAWALGIALFMTAVLMKIFRANDMLIHQVALSILFVLYFEHHSSGYAWDRAKDTLIGAIIGVAFVIFLFPPNEVKKTRQAMKQFAWHVVATIDLVTDRLHEHLPHSDLNLAQHCNALLNELGQMGQSLTKLEQGLPFAIYIKKTEVKDLQQKFGVIRDACVHLVVLSGSFTDDMTNQQREQWGERLRNLAIALRGQ